MYLKKIELAGFKSFARTSVFEFNTPITVIVGPNGSGKSNVAESVRFVLGEQSMKSLRSKKGEDLIFNGSQNIPRLNRASVTITFDNSRRAFDVDYDEVEIQRTVYRDGVNEYKINGTQVRLKDIVELLAGVNIGASSHHIISQGEADRILAVTSKERRNMVEDALGLKIYQYKKVESEKKLKKTRENIAQVQGLRKEIAPHIKFLEKQVDKINQSENLRKDLKELYIAYLGEESYYLAYQHELLKKDKNLPEEELAHIEKNLIEKEIVLKKLEEKNDSNDEIRDLEKKIRNIQSRKDELSRTLGRLEGMLEYETRQIENEKKEESKVKRVIIDFSSFKIFINELKNLVAESQKSENIEIIKSVIDRIKNTTQIFWEIHAESKERIKDIREGISEEEHEKTKKQKKNIENELVEISMREENLYKESSDAKNRIEKEKSSERILERKLFELRGRKNELVTKLELVKVHEENLKIEYEYYEQERTEAKYFLHDEILKEVEYEAAKKDGTPKNRREQDGERRKIERIKIKIDEIGSGGADVLKEYNDALERDQFLENEVGDLEKSADSLGKLIKELGGKINSEFKEGIKEINKHFQKFFKLMFDGGTASIKVIAQQKPKLKKTESDEDLGVLADIGASVNIQPFEIEEEEGIEVNINLPKKRVKGLQVLSGGERVLTSLALIFAMTQVHPPPFLILDETDAALDETNSRKYGSLLEQLSKKTQFIIITHNRETMTRAGVLYGITSASDGVSHMLSIKLDEAMEIVEE